jgi:enterobacterial common antigen flippase
MSPESAKAPITAPSLRESPPVIETVATEKNTYGQILKSSAIIGGSSVITIAIGIVRTKFMAVLLGPAGFGLMGLYGSIADLALSIAGMGVNSSGVRQIAEAVGTGDQGRIARTVAVLRRTSVILGILGAVLLIMFSGQVSTMTFGSDKHAAAVSLLSLVVFFTLVSNGQGALLQGLRRIADLARMRVLGALTGLMLSIPLVYFLREDGVVPSLVAGAAMMIIISWWYARKIHMPPLAMRVSQTMQEAGSLLKLGLAFMASGCLMMGAAYAVRTMVLRLVGYEAAGFFQAAWTLGGLYVGFILQAMGADFYPRLTAVAKDNVACNRMVNEQAQISLLLAGPGVITTLTFASVVIALFYSHRFEVSVGILRWICLGMSLRVITWPIGFIILAKGKANIFFWTELAWTVVNVGLTWLCLNRFGLNGAGIAFFGSYIFHGFLVYLVVRRLSRFRWSIENIKVGLLFISMIALVFGIFYLLRDPFAIVAGILTIILSSIFSIRGLLNFIPQRRIPSPVVWLLSRLGFLGSGSG